MSSSIYCLLQDLFVIILDFSPPGGPLLEIFKFCVPWISSSSPLINPSFRSPYLFHFPTGWGALGFFALGKSIPPFKHNFFFSLFTASFPFAFFSSTNSGYSSFGADLFSDEDPAPSCLACVLFAFHDGFEFQKISSPSSRAPILST